VNKVALVTWSNDFNPLHFYLCSYMKSRVYHDGEQEGRQQSAETTDEAAGVRKELGCTQWQQ
jgi:hypothetical protein